MSCPSVDRVLVSATPAGSAPELQAHVDGCADCQASLERLARARGVLIQGPGEPDDALWARIEAQVAPRLAELGEEPSPPALRWRTPWLASLGFAAGALVMALFLWRRPEPPQAAPAEQVRLVSGEARSGGERFSGGEQLRPGSALSLLRGTRLAAGRARVVAGPAATIQLPPEPAPRSLRLVKGALALSIDPVEPAEPFALHTPLGTLRALSGIFRVTADEGSLDLQVVEGEVEVETSSGQEIRVGEEQRLRLPALALSVHPSAAPAASAAPPLRPRSATSAATRVRPGEQAKVDPPAVVPAQLETPQIPPPARDDGARLAEARSVLGTDAPRARALAEQLLADRPAPAVEAAALMIQADAARRSGDAAAALAIFEMVTQHPAGDRYAEEAHLRAARLRFERRDLEGARRGLLVARQRIPRGPLSAERDALSSRVARGQGRVEEAAAVLRASPPDQLSVTVAEERLAVARALLAGDPSRAEALARPLAASALPAPLRAQALELMVDAARAQGDEQRAGEREQERRRLLAPPAP